MTLWSISGLPHRSLIGPVAKSGKVAGNGVSDGATVNAMSALPLKADIDHFKVDVG
jgi:hypothetical protein